MVILNLDIAIDEFISNTDSVISVYVDDTLIGHLDRNTRNWEKYVDIQGDKIKIVLKRQYKAFDSPRKTGFAKCVVSSIVSFLLLAGSTIEPFECPYECSETIILSLDEAHPRVSIMCRQKDGDLCPRFCFEINQHPVTTSKVLTVSKNELNNYYHEKRKQVLAMMCVALSLLVAIFVPAMLLKSQTTMVFSGILLGLVAVCTWASLKNLKREYLKILNRAI